MSDIEKFKIERMVEQFESRLAWQKEHSRSRSKQLMTECMLTYYRGVLDTSREGRPLAYTSVLFYPELVNSMGLTTFPIDQYCIQMLASGRGQEYIDPGISFGMAKEACSPHIATVGMAAAGIFPRPSLQFCTAQQPCDSASMLAECLNLIYRCPSFWLSMPHRHDEETIEYFKEELWDLVAFVEKHTGLTFNEEKLREMLGNARTCNEVFEKTHELRKLVPTPMRGRESFASMGPRMTSEGKPIVVEFLKAQYEEIKARADKGQGAVKEERHRMVINGAPPFWCLGIFDWMEEEFGAVVVLDGMNNRARLPIGDTTDVMDCVARKALGSGLPGKSMLIPYPTTADEIALKAREYGCDSSIFFAHFGCSQTCGQYRVVIDSLKDIAAIPTGIVGVDIGNPAIVSEAQMKHQIELYFRTLEERQASHSTGQAVRPTEVVELTSVTEDNEAGFNFVF